MHLAQCKFESEILLRPDSIHIGDWVLGKTVIPSSTDGQRVDSSLELSEWVWVLRGSGTRWGKSTMRLKKLAEIYEKWCNKRVFTQTKFRKRPGLRGSL